MSTQLLSRSPVETRRQLGEFLSHNLGTARLGWPLRTGAPRQQSTARRITDSLTGLRILIVGELTLELPVDVAATRRQLLASLQGDCPDGNLRWTTLEPQVGGFVAHAARASVALGARASVCTTVPVPIPARLERFLEEHGIDQRYLTGLPEPCPVTILFRCKDGWVVERHRRTLPANAPDLPAAAGEEFDTILVDPPHRHDASPVLRSVARCLDRGTDRLAAAVRLNRRSEPDTMSVACDSRVWTFIRCRDARKLAGGIGAPPGLDASALARCLHHRFGTARLVLQGGPRGAVLMNGIPCPYQVQTCPLVPANATGAGDTLMAVTVLSSASGADDRTSVRRGVAAATGQVAGSPLPTNLAELDAS
ncbi:MAG: PfkB family carbohydrate kinase [Planctomycetota bacterium]|jgi:sugar/nucleoside kinase (ribokinase family)